MKTWVAGVLGLLAAAACTKSNPAAKCTDNGTCTDPDYPFCDADGSIGGEPGACIAVTCTAGEFGSCSGSDTALVCDSSGETYDQVSCVNGCDPASGCITCTPNTQACANGTVTSCDGMGRLSTEACLLGCSTDATRCTELVPSNNLGMYYDLAMPDDLDLESGTLDLDASTFDDGMNVTTLPSFDVPAPTGGAPIRVFVVKHLTLGDILITSATAQQNGSGGVGRAVAFLATGDIDVTGRVVVQSGAVSLAGCVGARGIRAGNPPCAGGGGGGGFASAGAKGGSGPNGANGGAGGSISGTPELVPLRGGCPGSYGPTAADPGGGAIQLVSETTIHVTGSVVADGWGTTDNAGGGGAGGGILIETPSVVLDSSAKLLARGAGGAAGNAPPPMPPDDATAPPGGVCSPAGTGCGNGGNGATTTTGAGGGLAAGLAQLGSLCAAGGGGGGRGRIRINTLDGMFTQAPGSVVAGALSTGTVGTL